MSGRCVHNRHNLIPAGVDDSVGTKRRQSFRAGTHKGLEFRLETKLLNPLALPIEALDAKHRPITTLKRSKHLEGDDAGKQQFAFGIMLKSEPAWTDRMATLTALLLPVLLLFHLVGPIPTDLGLHNGQLSPCPSPAHCSSAVWPSADPQADLAAIAAALTDTPRVVVTELNDTYLHAEASSALFGFVDDLELLATDDAIQARSISRLGESDLGVNSARLNLLEPLVHPM